MITLGNFPIGLATSCIQVDGSWDKKTLCASAGWFVSNPYDPMGRSGGGSLYCKGCFAD